MCCAACFFLYLQSMTSRISDVEEGYGAVTEVQRPEGSKLGRFVRLAAMLAVAAVACASFLAAPPTLVQMDEVTLLVTAAVVLSLSQNEGPDGPVSKRATGFVHTDSLVTQ